MSDPLLSIKANTKVAAHFFRVAGASFYVQRSSGWHCVTQFGQSLPTQAVKKLLPTATVDEVSTLTERLARSPKGTGIRWIAGVLRPGGFRESTATALLLYDSDGKRRDLGAQDWRELQQFCSFCSVLYFHGDRPDEPVSDPGETLFTEEHVPPVPIETVDGTIPPGQAIVASLPESLTLIAPDGVVLACNEVARLNCEKVFRKPFGPGIRFEDFVAKPDLETYRKNFNRALEGQSTTLIRSFNRVDAPESPPIFYEMTYVPIREDNGPVIAVGFFVLDVTSRFEALRELSESTRINTILEEHSTDFIAVWEEAETVVYASPSIHSVLGIQPEQIVGSNFLDFVHLRDREHLAKLAEKAMRDPGFSALIEFRAMNSQGKWVTVEAICKHWNEDGAQGILVNARDVSQRKHEQATLDMLGEAMEGLSSGVIVMDGNLRVVYANQAAAELTGYKLSEIRNKRGAFLFETDPDTPEGKALRAAFNQRAARRMILESRRKDGTEFWCETSITPIERRGPESGYFVAILNDVTSQVRFERKLKESEERYSGIFRHSSEGIFLMEVIGALDFVCIDVNPALSRVFNAPPEALIGKRPQEMMDVEAASRFCDYLQMVLDIGKPVEFEDAFPESGRMNIWRTVLVPIMNDQGKVTKIIGNARDVTEQRRNQMLEKDRRRIFEAIVEQLPFESIIHNIVELVENQIPGTYCSIYLDKRQLDGQEAPLERIDHQAGGLVIGSPENLVERSDDQEIPETIYVTEEMFESALVNHLQDFISDKPMGFEAASVPVYMDRTVEIGRISLYTPEDRRATSKEEEIVAIAAQMTTIALEHNQLSQRLIFQARHDALTGLPNRYLMEDRLGQAIMQARLHSEPVVLYCMDLDGFKRVNDSFGHPTGDQLLKLVAERLRENLEPQEILGRVGGDEFMMVAIGSTQPAEILEKGERILQLFEKPFETDKREFFIGISIGISVFPQDGRDPETLQRNGDIALYKAKESGKNCIHYYTSEMHTNVLQRHRMEIELRKAIEREEIYLNYQPQFDLQTQELVGFEALMRWTNNVFDRVSPGEFIPILEEIGLIGEFGRWALHEACCKAVEWMKAHRKIFRMSVNVSPVQFRRPEFVEHVKLALDMSQLRPDLLELELTESVLVEDFESCLRRIRKLRELGCRIALDDFGTGYSSMSYLQQLPLDALKIDQSFVRHLFTGQEAARNDEAIVKTIIALGENFGLETIAEGIENEAQMEFLRKERCTIGQGYHLGRPMVAETVISDVMAYTSGESSVSG